MTLPKEVKQKIEEAAQEYAHSQNPYNNKFNFAVTDMDTVRKVYPVAAEHGYSLAQEEIQKLKEQNERYRNNLTRLILELEVQADGTNLKCACNNEGCTSLWLNCGDLIFRVPYPFAKDFKQALSAKDGE